MFCYVIATVLFGFHWAQFCCSHILNLPLFCLQVLSQVDVPYTIHVVCLLNSLWRLFVIFPCLRLYFSFLIKHQWIIMSHWHPFPFQIQVHRKTRSFTITTCWRIPTKTSMDHCLLFLICWTCLSLLFVSAIFALNVVELLLFWIVFLLCFIGQSCEWNFKLVQIRWKSTKLNEWIE